MDRHNRILGYDYGVPSSICMNRTAIFLFVILFLFGLLLVTLGLTKQTQGVEYKKTGSPYEYTTVYQSGEKNIWRVIDTEQNVVCYTVSLCNDGDYKCAEWADPSIDCIKK